MDTNLALARRAWARDQTLTAATDYICRLERALGVTPHVMPKVLRTVPAVFDGRKQRNASMDVLDNGILLLYSYETLVGAYDDKERVMRWSPERAWSTTSKRHITRWMSEFNYPDDFIISTERLDAVKEGHA